MASVYEWLLRLLLLLDPFPVFVREKTFSNSILGAASSLLLFGQLLLSPDGAVRRGVLDVFAIAAVVVVAGEVFGR